MRRLIAVAVAASALFVVPAPAAQAYGCGGVVDVNCTGWVCPTDCWQRDCTVWVDALKNPMTALCLG